MALLTALFTYLVKFIVFIGIAVGGFICGRALCHKRKQDVRTKLNSHKPDE